MNVPGEAVWGAPADFICLWNTSAGRGQREGPRLGHQGCFPWQRNVFSVDLELYGLRMEAVIPETGKGYKQYGNTWALLELLPPPAPLLSVAACCQEGISTTECVLVYDTRTCSISKQWGLDCTDVAYVSFSLVCFNYSFAEIRKCFIFHPQSNYNNLHHQWEIKVQFLQFKKRGSNVLNELFVLKLISFIICLHII